MQALPCLLWAMFPTPVQLSETLPRHLDLATCVQSIVQGGTWRCDFFQSANLKAIGMLFRIRSAMTHLEVSPSVNIPLWYHSHELPSFCKALQQFLVHLDPLLLSSSQKSRTLVPLLCCVLLVTVHSQATEDQRGAAVMRVHFLVLRTIVPLFFFFWLRFCSFT